MTKKLTAYFCDSETAGGAAFNIAQTLGKGSEIVLGTSSSEKAHAFDCCTISAFIGAGVGTVLGLILSGVSSVGNISSILPLCGLICGSVIGAITGCIIDLINYEQMPVCSNLTISSNKRNCSSLVRQLKKEGALKTVIIKG